MSDKPKKSRVKKRLNLSFSDEESVDSSKDVPKVESKLRLAETRRQVIHACGGSDAHESVEDPFNDSTSKSKPIPKKDKEMAEIISLLDSVKERTDNQKSDDNNDSVIIESDPEVYDQNVSSNTRSRSSGGRGRRRKSVPKKKITKKTNVRRGRKSKEFDMKSTLESFDNLEAMDDIHFVEELNTSLNVSQDIEEYIRDKDIEIRVKYKAVIETFTIKSTDKFSKLMPIIAEKFNEKVSELIFSFNERTIDCESTAESIGVTVSDTIVCYKTYNQMNAEFKDPNVLSLKLRDKTMKSAETLNVNKFDKIKTIIDWFAKFKSIPEEKFRLVFDGERLESDSTIAECDIDDDSQIDVILL